MYTTAVQQSLWATYIVIVKIIVPIYALHSLTPIPIPMCVLKGIP